MSDSSPATSTTSQIFVAVAMASGAVFFLASFMVSGPAPTRWSLATAGAMLVLVGAFTEYSIATANRRAQRIDELEAEVSTLETSNQELRSRLVFTLRASLSSIIGTSDMMINSPDIDRPQRIELLEGIRSNAREVDGVLAELGEARSSDNDDPRAKGVVLLDQEVRSVINTAGVGQQIDRDLQPSRAWGDSALVREVVRTVLAASNESGCGGLIVRTEERADRATVTFSAREPVLPPEGIAALTGNHQQSDATKTTFVALRKAYETAASMGGSIGYADVLGLDHVIVDFARVPVERPTSGEGATDDHPDTAPMITPKYTSAVDFRPERPTAALRFG